MATSQTREVAVFSNDINLMRSIEDGAFSSVSEQQFKYQVSPSIRDIKNLSDVDMIVYDLDLVDSDQARIIEDINHFILNADSKPLIVIGGKKAIKETLKLETIKPHIARTIAKPISYSAVRLLVNATLPKDGKSAPLTSEASSNKFKFAASLVIGLCSVLALGLFFMGGDEQSSLQKVTKVAKVSTSSTSNNEALDQATIDQAAIDQAAIDQETASSINGLLEKASIAKVEGRISSPGNDNALYYYNQVLAIDSYESEAYEGRKEILKALRESLPALLSANNIDNARHTLDTLIMAEPFHEGNKQLLSRFDKALTANKQSQKDASPSTPNKPVVVKTEVKPTKKTSRFTFSERIAEPIAKAEVIQPPVNAPQETKQPSVVENSSVNDTSILPRQQVATIAPPSIEQPLLIKRVGAKYPKRAFERDIEGWAEVAFQVNEEGKVINAKITNAQPETIFDTESLRAIKKWKFEPAKNNQTGETVTSSVKKTRFKFNLNFET